MNEILVKFGSAPGRMVTCPMGLRSNIRRHISEDGLEYAKVAIEKTPGALSDFRRSCSKGDMLPLNEAAFALVGMPYEAKKKSEKVSK